MCLWEQTEASALYVSLDCTFRSISNVSIRNTFSKKAVAVYIELIRRETVKSLRLYAPMTYNSIICSIQFQQVHGIALSLSGLSLTLVMYVRYLSYLHLMSYAICSCKNGLISLRFCAEL